MSNTSEVLVVRIGEILPHTNADKLALTMVNGYQMVIGKDAFKTGNLAVFIQPDSVVPQTEPFKFIWQDHVGIDGKVPEKRRRIQPKRLRGEWSEGLLLPVNDIAVDIATNNDVHDSFAFVAGGHTIIAHEGDNVAKAIGVTRYVPEFDRESTHSNAAGVPRRKYPKSLKGWFYFLLHRLGFRHAGGQSYAQEVAFDLPVYNVHALKQSRVKFDAGEQIHVTEKIHGSNARFTVQEGVFYAGSHEQWKQKAPGNVWWRAVEQHPGIEEWCFANEGKVLYGEVGPTQKGFRYGAEKDEIFFYAFDVYDPETGEWAWPGNEGFPLTVPVLYVGPHNTETVKLVDGPSTVPGAGHIREGVVIRSLATGLKLKVVSNDYLAMKG